MGVIAPEKNQKKPKAYTVGKKGFDLWWLLLVIVIFGIPLFTVEMVSRGKTHNVDLSAQERVQENLAYEETVESEVQESSSLENISVYSTNYYGSAEEYYRVPLKKNSKTGLYSLTAPVMDGARLFSKNQYVELASFILEMDRTYGIQIVVLTVDSLNGRDIDSFGTEQAHTWQLGQAGKDNGVLLTVAMDERDVRIDTGYGTEAVLTDAVCARIIRNVIVPAFRKGNYYEGVNSAVRNMAGLMVQDESLVTINNGKNSEMKEKSSDSSAAVLFAVIFIIFIWIKMVSNISRGKRSSIWPWIILGSSHHHGGHSSGGFGGGFHGGGGGFGGGGASGHW